MRKIIVITDSTLDGVVQSPGSPTEDVLDSFKYGGWIAPYLDKASNEAAKAQMEPAEYLLGRKTFGYFAGYWPHHTDYWPGINEGTKYVVSRTMEKSDWKNTVFLRNMADIVSLKNSEGPDLQVWGSGNLVQSLLKNDLVDELWLKIYPILIGTGKRLFADGTIPAAFTLTKSLVTPTGIIMANYKRAGEVKSAGVEV